MRSLRVISLATLLAIASPLASTAEPKVEQQVVAPPMLNPQSKDVTYAVSPRGVRLATVMRKGSRMVLVVDGGEPSPKFDEFFTPAFAWVDPRPLGKRDGNDPLLQRLPVTFSVDGKHFAYLARQSNEWVLAADGKEVARFPAGGTVGGTGGIAGNAGNTDVRLQFAGDHLFFARSTALGGMELWVDGKPSPGLYNSATGGHGPLDPYITSDGEHFLYPAVVDKKQTLVLDGKDVGVPAEVATYTADAKHVLAIVQGKTTDLVVDGKERMKTNGIAKFAVAPAGNWFAASVINPNPRGQFLTINTKRIPGTDCEEIPDIAISPDGKHFTAACKASNNVSYVVIDGKKQQDYSSIQPGSLKYSPDSSKVAYIAGASAGKYVVVVNDDESDAFDPLPDIAFSADGKHYAVAGRQNGTEMISIDGKPQRLGPGNHTVDDFYVSPDGSRTAFGRGVPIVLDGKETNINGMFLFSPDAKHVAITGTRTPDGKAGIFVDGQLVFEQKGNIRYLAFSPDSRHLSWLSAEQPTDPKAQPGSSLLVAYLDGKPAATAVIPFENQAPMQAFGYNNPPHLPPRHECEVDADGVITFLAPTADGITRFKITPSPDTGIATLLADAQKPAPKPRR